MKSVPAEDCIESKAEEKGVFFKGRTGRRKYSRGSSDVYSPFKCSPTGGKA